MVIGITLSLGVSATGWMGYPGQQFAQGDLPRSDLWSCQEVASALLLNDDTIRGWHKLFEQRGIEGATLVGSPREPFDWWPVPMKPPSV
jgi:hypothetical protein